MGSMRRVVVTGIGVIASNGIGKDAFWEAIKAGKSGITTITSFDPAAFACRFAGEVKDFHPEEYVEQKNIRRMDRTSLLGVAAAKMAVKDAGVDFSTNGGSARTGVMIGTAMAGHGYIMDHYAKFLQRSEEHTSELQSQR